jgi:hypothetical protein
LSGFLIRYVDPLFAYLKLFSFIGLTLTMTYLSLVVVISVLKHRAKAIILL